MPAGRPVTGDDYDSDDPSAYDRDHCYTTDTGTTTMRCRVSDAVQRWATEIAQDPLFVHFRTPSDVMRDALIHNLHYRAEQLTDPIRRLQLTQEIDRFVRQERTFEMEAAIQKDEDEARIIMARWKTTADPVVRTHLKERIAYLKNRPLADAIRQELWDLARRIERHEWDRATGFDDIDSMI